MSPLLARPLAGQQVAQVQVYHGIGQSGALAYEIGRGEVKSVKSGFHWVLGVGTRVCVQVVNAHPVHYGYSLTAKVDTTAPPLPDLSRFVSVIGELLGPGAWAVRGVVTPPGAAPTDSLLEYFRRSVRSYLQRLDTLASEIRGAARIGRESDRPEPKTDPTGTFDDRGYRWAVRAIGGLSSEPGHFGDPELAARVEEWGDALLNAAPPNTPEAVILADALRAHGDDVLVAVQELWKNYESEAAGTVTRCVETGDGRTTITLTATKRLDDGARDTGALVEIVVDPTVARPRVEIVPTVFFGWRPDVPEFSLAEGVIEEREGDAMNVRGGLSLLVNLWYGGERREVSAGPLFGLGFSDQGTADNPTDFVFGLMASYRNLVRIGIGAGWTAVPDKLQGGLKAGDALPEDVENLDDLIVTAKEGGLFILLGITGLQIP